MSQQRDKEIQELTKKIEEKKQALDRVKRYSYDTHMALNINATNYNLHTIDDVSLLISLIANLELNEKTFKDTIKKHNLPDISYKHQSYDVVDWVGDILARIKKINSIKEARELTQMQAVLNELLSQDFKTELRLEEIKKKIN